MRLSLIVVLSVLSAPVCTQTISPLDRSNILNGAHFDVEIQFDHVLPASGLKATLNGKALADVFGKQAEQNDKSDTLDRSRFIWRDVSLSDAGNYTLEVDDNGKKTSAVWNVFAANEHKAKNVILFIGDGMSLAHRTAARILSKGIAGGKLSGELAMDEMPAMALVSTLAANSISTDSANTATAYTTGAKAPVSALGVFEDDTKDPFDNPKMETLGSIAKKKGLAVGIITDAEVTDATPAAMYGHSSDRSEASHLLDELLALKPDVVMGGGMVRFQPQSIAGSKRKDDIDALAKFKEAGYAVVQTASELASASNQKMLLGLFASGNMDGALDRKFLKTGSVKDYPDQPDLTQKLQASLDILSKNDKGFVLLAEAGLIDKYTHSLDMERAVYDTIMLDSAVKLAKEWSAKNGNETLILVVADHGHPVSLVGTVNDDMSKEPVTAMREHVGVYEAAGLPNYGAPDKDGYPPRVDVSRRVAIFSAATPDYYETFRPKLDKPFKPTVEDSNGHTYSANPDYKDQPGAMFREGILPKTSGAEVHSGDDVVLTAIGPGADKVHGHLDNTDVFKIMVEALGLGAK